MIGAQRLSASTNGSQEHGRRSFCASRRAQRLSASTNGSRFCSSGCSGNHTVLNAFRHQRMDHAGVVGNSAGRLACSTPFGINEWITTTFRPQSPQSEPVLNAFRHQRMDHMAARGDMAVSSVCSTPFGINEWITSTFSIAALSRSPCSTPFGINEWITRQQAGPLLRSWVLNAFRHQRMDHCRSHCQTSDVRTCAQRLSASTNGSPCAALSFAVPCLCAQRLSASTNGSRYR